MAQIFKAKTLVSNSGRFAYEVIAPNLVYNTGNQNISGVKNFYSRPTVNGTGVLLTGEPATIIGNLTVNGDEKASNAIFYVQDNLALNEKFTLTTGSQFIFSKRDYRDFFLSDGNQSGKRYYHGISPKIGGIYQHNKNLLISYLYLTPQ